MRKLVLLIAIAWMLLPLQAQQKTARIEQSLSIFNDVLRQLDMNYVDTLNYEEITEVAINQMLRKADPYTVYFSKKQDDDLRMMTQGKYGGIGAIIQQRDSIIIVANPYEGKPAQRNDVLSGDVLVSVDGVQTKGKKVSEVSNLLRGVPGTIVQLELMRDTTPISRAFAREDIHMDAVDYYAAFDSIGYIAFSEFTEGSALEFNEALKDLVRHQHIKGLIIDLRGNGGGIIDEAIQIVANFVPKNTLVVSTKGKITVANREYYTQTKPAYPQLPLVVMVDDNSASASEIVSGSLQDLHRATLIGQRTFGKGLVQNLRPIAYGGHLKVTTSKYYLPSGRCIQAIDYEEAHKGKELKRDTAGGILPDIVLNDSSKVSITYALYTQNHFFDYSVRYHRLHDSIAQPLDFNLTNDDIEDFCRFLDERDFHYETETSKYFQQMMDVAKMEDIDSTTLAALQALEAQLKPSFRDAIARHIDEVKELLGAEIVERYYFQKGRIAYLLRFDEELERALQEITVVNK